MKTCGDQDVGVICSLDVVQWRVAFHVFIVLGFLHSKQEQLKACDAQACHMTYTIGAVYTLTQDVVGKV